MEAEMDMQMTRERLWDAIARLPRCQREAVGLAFIEGIAHPEIAERLGAPLGTIKTRIRWGLKAIRSEFHSEQSQMRD